MKKNSKKVAKSGKKTAKEKLAAGAKEIRKAEKAAKVAPPPPEPVVLPESTRPIEDIVRDRVTLLPGHIGIKLADDTPIEESLRVLDWTTTLADHVGFMIGDVLNFGEAKWGEKYTQALSQTGRAYSTLKGYSEAARRIPFANRVASLSFTHHREILRIGDDTKIASVLKEVGKQADEGHAPTTKELRFKVQKLTPRKKKVHKGPPTSGKGKKGKAKKVFIAYVPTDEEQSKLDAAEDAVNDAAQLLKSGGVFKIVARLDNKDKQRWLGAADPIVTFWKQLTNVTGY